MNLLAERDLIRYLYPFLDADQLSDIEVLRIIAETGNWEPDSFARNRPVKKPTKPAPTAP